MKYALWGCGRFSVEMVISFSSFCRTIHLRRYRIKSTAVKTSPANPLRILPYSTGAAGRSYSEKNSANTEQIMNQTMIFFCEPISIFQTFSYSTM